MQKFTRPHWEIMTSTRYWHVQMFLCCFKKRGHERGKTSTIKIQTELLMRPAVYFGCSCKSTWNISFLPGYFPSTSWPFLDFWAMVCNFVLSVIFGSAKGQTVWGLGWEKQQIIQVFVISMNMSIRAGIMFINEVSSVTRSLCERVFTWFLRYLPSWGFFPVLLTSRQRKEERLAKEWLYIVAVILKGITCSNTQRHFFTPTVIAWCVLLLNY